MANREPVVRQVDGRGEDLREGQGAVSLVGGQPAIDQSGRRNRKDAGRRDAVQPVGVILPRCCQGSGAGAVANLDSPGFLLVNHDETVAANSGHQRLNDIEGGGGGNRGVHRIAAHLQHGDSRLRCQRVAGGDHTLAAHDHRPVGLKINAVG